MKTIQSIFLLTLLNAGVMQASNSDASGTFTFVAPCQPFAIVTAIPNQNGCFSFSATNGGASDSNGFYAWDFGDGTSGIGSSIVHCYPTNPVQMQYTATVVYHSTLVCGNDPLNQKQVFQVQPGSATGIANHEVTLRQIKLLPNPASDQLMIRSDVAVTKVVLCDHQGREVFTQKMNATELVLPVSDYPEGLYLVKISYFDGTESQTKFIKQ